jgi:hypothetical protein
MPNVIDRPIYDSSAKADAPPKPKKATFEIVVRLETKDGVTSCVPVNIPEVMHQGDTVTYMSPDGTVEVNFDPDSDGSGKTSPYADATGDLPSVKGGVLLSVVNKGDYFGHCGIYDPVTGTALAKWTPTTASTQQQQKYDQKSGGNHVVR